MLYHFLAAEVYGQKTAGLFDGLKIAKVGNGVYLEYQGKYPVIFISFKDIKSHDFANAYNDIAKAMSDLYKDLIKIGLAFSGKRLELKSKRENICIKLFA